MGIRDIICCFGDKLFQPASMLIMIASDDFLIERLEPGRLLLEQLDWFVLLTSLRISQEH
ncbi:hypothetical protein P5673_011126 [Acropora cervicornis]|uniref:Uncharacterized protein n=1 Tax=Acropora cervicornis TaxID=6130 RepID=A0AAD9QPT5_ACRCE|nr:hypothetical protein P5673_011126 [Acropora cervicornis]